MSAITGIFLRNGISADPMKIKKMNNSLSHRGPDGSNIWLKGSIALGHQMLHSTSESLHEKLPYSDDEGLIITADSRIDNRDELSNLLEIENHDNIPDSYFILKAYHKWGENCPKKLLGDFAFAIWDEENEKLFCARDHMGVKPFYYYLSDDIFLFATEMKALFTMSEFLYKLNETKVAYYLMFEYVDKIFTFYEDILRLPAACSLKINQEEFKINKYWELDPEYNVIMDSDEDYINAFRDIFREAVNCRLRSAFPIGFELSGGLDSSSIVCMAKKILNEKYQTINLNTYSYSFKNIPEVDERPYIKSVLNKGGINHNFIYGDVISPMEDMENIIWHLEQPSYNPYFPIICKLYKKMYDNNIRVSLSGSGGDGTISHGDYYIKDLASTFQFNKLIRELNDYSKLINQSFTRSLINQVIFPLLPIEIKNFLLFKIKRVKNQNYILNPKFNEKIGGKEKLNKLLFYPSEISAKSARKYHFFELNDISVQSFLEDMDKMGSAFQIESRYPYFDKRLIEFCYGVPNEMKFRFGWGRYLQRVAMTNILPQEVQWRHSKISFSPILERNLLIFEKKRLEQILYHDNKLIKNYVDLDKLKNMYQRYSSGKHYEAGDVRDLWLIMILNFWLQKVEFPI